jgi:hypothetical protein
MREVAANRGAIVMPPRWGWGDFFWTRSAINMPLLTELNAPILCDWLGFDRKCTLSPIPNHLHIDFKK